MPRRFNRHGRSRGYNKNKSNFNKIGRVRGTYETENLVDAGGRTDVVNNYIKPWVDDYNRQVAVAGNYNVPRLTIPAGIRLFNFFKRQHPQEVYAQTMTRVADNVATSDAYKIKNTASLARSKKSQNITDNFITQGDIQRAIRSGGNTIATQLAALIAAILPGGGQPRAGP